jgi:hypothetical protein
MRLVIRGDLVEGTMEVTMEVTMVGGTMVGDTTDGIGLHHLIRPTHVRLATCGIRTCIRTALGDLKPGGRAVTFEKVASPLRLVMRASTNRFVTG